MPVPERKMVIYMQNTTFTQKRALITIMLKK
jgi:hypothetical protein